MLGKRVLLLLFILSAALTMVTAPVPLFSDAGAIPRYFQPSLRVPLFIAAGDGSTDLNLEEKQFKLSLDKLDTPFTLTPYPPENATSPAQWEGRDIVIILDTTLTPSLSFDEAKKISRAIIEKGSPGDTFSLLQLSPLQGPRFIFCREKNKKSALKQMKAAVRYAEPKLPVLKFPVKIKYARLPNYLRGTFFQLRSDGRGPRSFEAALRKDNAFESQQLSMSYFLSGLKRGLKASGKPKLVFLVSALTLPSRALKEDSRYAQLYLGHLHSLAREVISSGSLLFLINPGKPVHPLPAPGGAALIHGPALDDALQKINALFDGYRELRVAPGEFDKFGDHFKVTVSHPNKSISLHYPPALPPPGGYYRMTDRDKRLFLSGLLLEAPWTHFAGRLAAAEILPASAGNPSQPAGNSGWVTINIPPEIRMRRVDVYTLRVHPQKGTVEIRLSPAFAKNKLQVQTGKLFSGPGDRYFAVIEPISGLCLYNEVTK